MAMKSILELRKGERARIDTVGGGGSIRQRLLDMGLLPNEELRLERVAPSGNPIWIELNGTHLALRKEEAAVVLVESDDE